jgi:2'-5' RNA ligase
MDGDASGRENTIRCFVAVTAPEAVRGQAAGIQAALRRRAELSGIRWLKPDSFHITLKFLGDVPVEDIPYIAQQLSIVSQGCRPTQIRLDRLGVFPNAKRPRVLWWGSDPEAVPAEFRAVHFHVQEALHLLGFEKEDRPFHPHLTLGRIRDNADPGRVTEVLRETESGLEADFPIRRIELMESRLHPQGAIYETLAEVAIEEKTGGGGEGERAAVD